MIEVLAHINGQDLRGGGDVIAVENPSTGEQIAALPEATPDQVATAVGAAAEAFTAGIWSDTSVAERQTVLRKIAAGIRAEADTLNDLQIAENGMTRPGVSAQVAAAAGWFEYYADFLSTLREDAYTRIPGTTTLVERVPIGVCALFSPWNVPVTLTALKLAPALAAGNTVVVKPSEMTPLVTRKLIDIALAAELPPGVVNLVNGCGPVTGAALAQDPRVAMIAFTGGEAAGKAVALAAAARHAPCLTELGGKSATLIFGDADLDAAVPGAALAAFGANGEACLAGARILVEDSIAEEFFAKFCTQTKALKVGPADAPDTQCGPMISAAHREHVLSFYDGADDVLCGGPLEGSGHFVAPGAIRIKTTTSRVWQEEVFGPLAAVTTFRDEGEAIALANDTRFGLAGYVWTKDLSRAHRVCRRLRTGSVIVNSAFIREQNAPFGGFLASGVGREGGRYSWDNFTEARTTVIRHG